MLEVLVKRGLLLKTILRSGIVSQHSFSVVEESFPNLMCHWSRVAESNKDSIFVVRLPYKRKLSLSMIMTPRVKICLGAASAF